MTYEDLKTLRALPVEIVAALVEASSLCPETTELYDLQYAIQRHVRDLKPDADTYTYGVSAAFQEHKALHGQCGWIGKVATAIKKELDR